MICNIRTSHGAQIEQGSYQLEIWMSEKVAMGRFFARELILQMLLAEQVEGVLGTGRRCNFVSGRIDRTWEKVRKGVPC